MPDSEHDFGRLYTEYRPRIRRYVARIVGEHDAEDLTQTVFLKVSHALKDFRGESTLSTWIYRIAQEGKFNVSELQHYRSVIQALRRRGIEPIVTLHHFTNPLWFLQKGGWVRRDAYKYFNRYVLYVVSALGEDVRYWVTINEPLVYAYHSYLLGAWPPQEKSFVKTKNVMQEFGRSAHKIL